MLLMTNSYNRIIELPKRDSFFLFGPRGSGKSSLLRERLASTPHLLIDLLDRDLEADLKDRPNILKDRVEALPPETKTIVIDEVQKIPDLLDLVHLLIEKKQGWKFILTGSSARKLKRGGANLLAGRAFLCTLDPFVSMELGDDFDLNHAMRFGMLPYVWNERDPESCESFLRTYTYTYLKEEIAQEQIVRRIDPFRKFLEVAAQSSGKIVNHSLIARDCGVSDKTVAEYYSILEDTLVGFAIEPFMHSFRKRLRSKPKFYLFDVGVMRALSRMLSVPPVREASYYGELFEQHVIIECHKLAKLYSPDTRMSFLQTEGGREIDLVLERPGMPLAFVEIKSAAQIHDRHIDALKAVRHDFPEAELFCLCQEQHPRLTDERIHILPWQEGLKVLFKGRLANGFFAI